MFKVIFSVICNSLILGNNMQADDRDYHTNPGVLIIAHGSHKGGHHASGGEHDHWNETVKEAVETARSRINFPVELAFGIWDQDSFQSGIDRLAAQNICELRIVPLFVSTGLLREISSKFHATIQLNSLMANLLQ